MLLTSWSYAALADVPGRVATDITPVYSLVAQIMAGVGTPELIIQHGASPHHYQMKPSDAGSLQMLILSSGLEQIWRPHYHAQ